MGRGNREFGGWEKGDMMKNADQEREGKEKQGRLCNRWKIRLRVLYALKELRC